MTEAFIATLTPMLTLFICMGVGFLTKKFNILPDSASTVLARLETHIIFPALSFVTMARNCTPDTVASHGINIISAFVIMLFAILISKLLSRFFVKEDNSERGIYKYALAFANSTYIGDPLVLAMFGERMLSFYKMYTFPLIIGIYTWGFSCLIPKEKRQGSLLKNLFSPSIAGLILGIGAGLLGLYDSIPLFAQNALDSIKGCMGPIAMILAGFTVAAYPIKEMLTDKKVYLASILRLTLIPTVLIALLFGLKEALNLIFGLSIGNIPIYLCFFATAAPLGLNTVVFPAAYGGNPKTGASMALISHTLSVITIPIMYSILGAIFGAPIL